MAKHRFMSPGRNLTVDELYQMRNCCARPCSQCHGTGMLFTQETTHLPLGYRLIAIEGTPCPACYSGIEYVNCMS